MILDPLFLNLKTSSFSSDPKYSFFHQFKAERIHRNEYVTEKELRSVIIEYVGFYNQKRIHSSLDYMTPNEYEVRMG